MTQNYLITAAHCFLGTPLNPKYYYALLGDHNFKVSNFSEGKGGRERGGALHVPPQNTHTNTGHCFPGTPLDTKYYFTILGDNNFQAK